MSKPNQSYLLQVDGLSKSFRGLQAVSDYDLTLEAGELVGIIGPNGAGKTTLFNLLTGVVTPSAGRIIFNNTDITHSRPERIARLGIARTFQKLRLFSALSALENVKVALQTGQQVKLWDALLSLPRFTNSERQLTEQAVELLDFLGLAEARHAVAHTLSFGQQRRLEITCALALSPRLLLLDEPAGGMNPSETDELMKLIVRLRQQLDLTIILIEHNMQVIMGICRRIQALNYGQVIAEGEPAAIRRDTRVIEAYLGQVANDVAA
jgi:branched-chain amino acid transport system ATP-binding protein